MSGSWTLECSACGSTRDSDGIVGVCSTCGGPYLVRYTALPSVANQSILCERPFTMWRYREWLPLSADEVPVTLGEGGTPLLPAPRIGERYEFGQLLIKEEGVNPTGSFKARGLAAAVTRAVSAGAPSLVLPTAGNAGVALAAYAARAGVHARVYAPLTTPAPILGQIRAYGAELVLVDGHIGDAGQAARTYASEKNAVDLSTLREPYRLEGKKTLGLELAEQLGWTLPDAIIYPTGGGTGLIGMWKAFEELGAAGWVEASRRPRMYAVQAAGCAPVVQAFLDGADRCEPWMDPCTAASGLRVPRPFGDRLILQALRSSGGAALAVSEQALRDAAKLLREQEAIDAAPEGGAALAAAIELRRRGVITGDERVVVFNTGAGWLYRA